VSKHTSSANAFDNMLLILTDFNTCIVSAPSGEASRSHVISGDNVTYTCRVSYVSSSVLKMWWTDTATGRTVSPPGGRVSTDDLNSSLIHMESSLTVTVLHGVTIVQPYTCSVVSTPTSDTLQLTGRPDIYTWNSTAITVSCELTMSLPRLNVGVIRHAQLEKDVSEVY